MNDEKIVAGIGSSGLTDKYDIKILICYLLNNISQALTQEELFTIIEDSGYVNYFNFCESVNELLKNGNIRLENKKYVLNELGIDTAQRLSSALPVSLRDNVVSCAIRLIAKIKQSRENEIIIEKLSEGYNVKITLHDKEYDLMSLTLFVPDILQAETIKNKFNENPSGFYSSIIDNLFAKSIEE